LDNFTCTQKLTKNCQFILLERGTKLKVNE